MAVFYFYDISVGSNFTQFSNQNSKIYVCVWDMENWGILERQAGRYKGLIVNVYHFKDSG